MNTNSHSQPVTKYLFTAPTCFGHRTWPSSGSYKVLRLYGLYGIYRNIHV